MRWTDRFREAVKAWRLGGQVGVGLDRQVSEVFSFDQRRNDPAKLVQLSTAVYTAVDLRSTTLSSIPILIYRELPDGSKEKVTSGPVYDLFKFVNPHWSLPRLMAAVEMSLCVYGQAFVIIERNSRNVPVELWYAPAEKMKIVPHPTDYIEKFVFSTGHGKHIDIAPEDVIWIPGVMDPNDEFRCLSPLEAARMSIESSLDAMAANQNIFRNGMNPGGILSPKDAGTALTKEQRESIEHQLNLRLRGADKAHKLAVFSHPMDIQTPQLTPADAEFMSLLEWTLADIARVYKVPPTKLQDFSRATYSNVEQADKALYTDCIIPEAERIASAFIEQLLVQFGDEYHLEFDFSQVRSLQEDQMEITQQMVALHQIGVPLNKLLEVYRPDLLPEGTEGYPWGDAPPMPALTLGMDEEDITTKVVEVNAEKSVIPEYGSPAHKKALASRDRKALPFERRLRGAVRDAQKQMVEDINKKLSQPLKAASPLDEFDDEDYIDIISRAYASAGVSSIIAGAYARAAMDALKRVGSSIKFDQNSPSAERFLAKREQRFAVSIPEDQWKELKASLIKGMREGQGSEGLKKIVETHPVVSPARAEMVARTEVIGAYNGGLEEGWKQSEIEGSKVWIAALDSRTRESHRAAHGLQVPLSEDFGLISGAKGASPGQTGVAEEDINCRCTMDYIPD